jgi:hypothetical protein
MCKAANRQTLRKEDFLKISNANHSISFQNPVPPTVLETEEDDDVDENVKLQPLNIPVLKDIMNRKAQKITMIPGFINVTNAAKQAVMHRHNSKSNKLEQSTASMKTNESNN